MQGVKELLTQIQTRFDALVQELQEQVKIDNRLQFNNIIVSATIYDPKWPYNMTAFYQATDLKVYNPNNNSPYDFSGANDQGLWVEGASGSTRVGSTMTFTQFKNFLQMGEITNQSPHMVLQLVTIKASIKILRIIRLKPLDIGLIFKSIQNPKEYVKDPNKLDSLLKENFINWKIIPYNFSYSSGGHIKKFSPSKTFTFGQFGVWGTMGSKLCNLSNVNSFKKNNYNSSGDKLTIDPLPC